MQKTLTFLAPLAMAVTLAMPVAAQDTVTKDTVLATVNGTDITMGHVIVAAAILPEQYRTLPDAVLFQGVLDQLIQQQALADQFEGDLPARATLSLENERRSLTAGEKVEELMAAAVTDADAQAAYDEQYGGADAQQEYNASHILVETKEEADAIKADLDGGADFGALAREKSTGPSGPSGGSLGWFGAGQMVPAFEQATFALSAGEVSEPVQTQFGWHVILLSETRIQEAPAFADVEEELKAQIAQVRIQDQITEAEATADVDRSGAEGVDPTMIKNLDLVN